jgi:hypothetical protein
MFGQIKQELWLEQTFSSTNEPWGFYVVFRVNFRSFVSLLIRYYQWSGYGTGWKQIKKADSVDEDQRLWVLNGLCY